MRGFFSVKLKHTVEADGVVQSKTSVLLVDSDSHGGAETSALLFGNTNRTYRNCSITSVIPTKIMEVFQNGESGVFFLGKCQYTEESVNGKPMLRAHTFLVEAENLVEANETLLEKLEKSMIDYTATEIKKSQYCDVVGFSEYKINPEATNDAEPEKETENF